MIQVRAAIPFGRLLDGITAPEGRTARAVEIYDRLQQEIAALPGVRGVAVTSVVPLTPDRQNNYIDIEGYDGQRILTERRFVSWNYFEVTGTRMVEGRAFSAADDRPDAPDQVVVSRGVAELVWPGVSAIGRRIQWGGRMSTVIGVAENLHDEDVRKGTEFALYVPRQQSGFVQGQLLVRTDGDLEGLIPAIRARVAAVERGIAVPVARPLTQDRDRHIAAERYRARLVGVFSGLAALFAIMGIYGVTARSVASRRRELGVRMALGAGRERVLGLVVVQGLRLALAGAAAGTVLSLFGTRFLERYLWGVAPTDVATLLQTALAVGLASVMAALAPGWRATRADPLDALRSD